jgi:hypothetical protein
VSGVTAVIAVLVATQSIALSVVGVDAIIHRPRPHVPTFLELGYGPTVFVPLDHPIEVAA